MSVLTVILPSYNRAHALPGLLQAYEQQETELPFDLIVVDDASTDQTQQILQSYSPQRYSLQVIRQDMNQGQGAARNQAIPLVKTPLTLIVGDDMFPTPGLLQGHIQTHLKWDAPQVAVLGQVQWPVDMPVNTLMAHIDGVGAQQFPFHYLQNDSWYDFKYFYTSNISVKTDFLRSLDRWFNPGFRLYGFEDIELGYRLALRGLRIRYHSCLNVTHYHYHNIWTFARRQQASGRMAHVLFQSHPSLRLKFPMPTLRMGRYRLLASFTSPNAGTIIRWQQIACRLVSNYEWQYVPGLNNLYRQVLEYFYYDGLVAETLVHSRLQTAARTVLIHQLLLPAIARWRAYATEQQIPCIKIPE
jgi:glycosyltransferase involved in cell wall biosynthesis